MHDAILRGANVDPLELVFGGHLALDEFAEPAVELAQLLRHLAGEVLIDLQDLQLDLADLAARLRHREHRLRPLAGQPRGFALERDQPVDLHQVLAPELAHALELAPDQVDLLGLRLLQSEVALDLLAKLGGALLELRFLAETHTAPRLEQLAFAIDGGGDIGILRAGEKLGGKGNLLGPVTLGDEAGAPRGHFVEPLEHDREVRARDGVVEAQHDVSRADALTVAHEQFADDAAGRMLDLLHVGIDHDRCRRDDGAGQLGGRGPAADAADQHDGDDGAAEEMMADRAALVDSSAWSSDHPFVWEASLSGVGLAGTRGAARARTSSFGPKVCCLPWFISST